MPRPRDKGNLDLPPHVEVDTRKGKKYYRYVLPNGQRRSLGVDKQAAIDAAMTLNVTLTRNPSLIDNILRAHKKAEDSLNLIPPLNFAVEKFTEYLNMKNLAVSTRKEQGYKLNAYKKLWGEKQPNEIGILDIAGFLNTKKNNSYHKHRVLLVEFWSFLTHQGWAKENVPELTLIGITEKKKRKRHTAEALNEIHRISPPWLQRAINLARRSVQRRGDLVLLHKDMVSLPANTITILQSKTKNYTTPVFMEINMHAELREAVIDCLSDKLAFICPYLLHYKPARLSAKIREAKPHHLAVTDDYLTTEFAHYRDLSGVYDHYTAEEKPSFHDIRALGMYELEKKYNKEYANALAGHASMKMTDHYLEGHEPIKPIQVSFVQEKAN